MQTDNITQNLYLKNKSLLLIVFLLSVSCNKSLLSKKDFQGSWIIEKSIYNGKDFNEFLSVNMFIFSENDTCYLPTIYKDESDECKWRLESSSDTLILSCVNNLLQGRYKVNIKDSNDFTYLILKSDSIEFTAKKW